MAGKGPRHDSKDGHHSKESYHSKDGSRRAASPGPPPSVSGSVRPSSSKLNSDAPPSIVGPVGAQTPPMVIEQRLAAQHAEIQRLLGENQRLAVTHVALRQELAAAQQEILRLHQSRSFGDTEKEQRFTITQVALRQELADAKQEVSRLQEAIAAIQAEKDQHIRATVERGAHMEAELKSTESLKGDFEKMRYEREELAARVEHLTGEVRRLPVKDQEIASLKSEVDELRQRHQQARMDFELQKKINLEHLEQKQAMEKNAFTMAREVERLRTELMSMERRLHGAYPAPSGGTAPPPLHSSVLPVGAYENNYGSQQEVSKSGQQSVDLSESKTSAEAAKYRAGIEAFQSGMQAPQDRLPANADPAGEWVKHAAPNGKAFYYNAVTGATQWNKPSLIAGADPHASHQRQLPQAQGQATQDPSSEPVLIPTPPQQPPLTVQQLPPPQQAISPATMHQGGQLQAQQANYGINLLVLGLSEGITDRDLASLFHPYGTILYAKVVMDNKSGPVECYGIVTMENPQAAEAAAAAVSGMFILGRHIKVEIQAKEQGPPHQQGYPQPSMQQGMMQGGVGPVRWQHRATPAGGGRWPY